MYCLCCQHLEDEVHRLELIHARKLRVRKDNWQKVTSFRHGHLRSAENAAMLRLEIARAQLNRHKREEHNPVAGASRELSTE